MSEKPKMRFEQNIMEVLINAQKKVDRLKIGGISDILVFKELIYMQSTRLSDFMMYVGVSWKKLKNAIENEFDNWKRMKKDPKRKVIIRDCNNKAVKREDVDFVLDENLIIAMNKTPEFTSVYGLIDETALILAILDDPSEYVVDFFKEIKIDIDVVIKYFEGILFENDNYGDDEEVEDEEEFDQKEGNNEDKKEEDRFVIPEKLSGFLKVMKAETSKTSPILGREEETEKLTTVLLKAKKSNAILVGKPGVGKTAIVEDLAWRIKNGKCAEELKGKTILELSVNDIIAGTVYRGMAEERFKCISDFLSKTENVILFIDEIHNAVGAGSISQEGTQDLANSLKPILAREGISIIGATTTEEYKRIFKKDGAFKRRFEAIPIREPKSSEVYDMVKEQVRNLSKKHGVSITKSVVEYIIKVSGCFNFETGNPDRTLDLVDKSMATAKIKGEKVVTREIVLKNFDANFKMYAKMSEEYKLSTAYHEAGHYIVARYGKHFPLQSMAVSIVPAEGYLGVTVYDDEPILLRANYMFHIESIARSLGGRVAEKMYTGEYSSGARTDLEYATDEARKIIVEYGLSGKFAMRNSDNDFYDEKSKMLNEEIDRIIGEAYKVAEDILKEHEEALKAISNELLKKGILMKEDLDRICKRVEGKTAQITRPENIIVE